MNATNAPISRSRFNVILNNLVDRILRVIEDGYSCLEIWDEFG